jgi:hypothetical protein
MSLSVHFRTCTIKSNKFINLSETQLMSGEHPQQNPGDAPTVGCVIIINIVRQNIQYYKVNWKRHPERKYFDRVLEDLN